MFQINDYVMHGGNGVCQIAEIGSIDLCGVSRDKLYYTLKPMFGKGNMIYTPIDSEKIAIRELISVDEANDLLANATNIEIVDVPNEKMRENVYKDIIKTYDCKQWLRLIKTIYLRKEEREEAGKKITSLDDRYMKIAGDYLMGELIIVLGMEKEQIEEKILDIIRTSMLV